MSGFDIISAMKLGMSSASFFPNLHTEDTLEEIASLGIDTCEVFFETRSQYCEEYANIMKDKLKRANEIHKLEIHSAHSMTNQFEPDLFSQGERARADGEEIYRNFLATCKSLGIKYQTFHGATILKRAVKYTHDYEKLSKRVNYLVDLAKSYGVKLCYENVHWTYFHEPEYFEKLKPYCPELGSVLDIKQAMQSGIDYKDYLKVMGNTLETVHLCDYNIDGTTAIPGKGSFDFVELFKRLQDIGYDGPCLLEVYSKNYKDIDELKESYNYLEVCLDKSKK